MYLTLAGKEGLEKIAEIISYYRNNDAESFGNKKAVEVKEFANVLMDCKEQTY